MILIRYRPRLFSQETTVKSISEISQNPPQLQAIVFLLLINPLIVYSQGQGCVVADSRILLKNPPQSHSDLRASEVEQVVLEPIF